MVVDLLLPQNVFARKSFIKRLHSLSQAQCSVECQSEISPFNIRFSKSLGAPIKILLSLYCDLILVQVSISPVIRFINNVCHNMRCKKKS